MIHLSTVNCEESDFISVFQKASQVQIMRSPVPFLVLFHGPWIWRGELEGEAEGAEFEERGMVGKGRGSLEGGWGEIKEGWDGQRQVGQSANCPRADFNFVWKVSVRTRNMLETFFCYMYFISEDLGPTEWALSLPVPEET